jgi:8-oxo-dGTP diphosphatase
MNKPILKVTCAIIIRSAKILVAQRGEFMSLPLKWEFPGGKMEGDESEEDCLLREIREELDVEIEIIDKLEKVMHDYGNVIVNLIPFICVSKTFNLKLAEHKDAKWLSKEDLLTLEWAPADIPILNQLLLTNYV